MADSVLSQLRHVAGLTDLRIQQEFDYPRFNVDVDRTKAAAGRIHGSRYYKQPAGRLERQFSDHAAFFLNWKNGVQYEMISQNPQYRVQSLQDVGNIPISSAGDDSSGNPLRVWPPSTAGVRWKWCRITTFAG